MAGFIEGGVPMVATTNNGDGFGGGYAGMFMVFALIALLGGGLGGWGGRGAAVEGGFGREMLNENLNSRFSDVNDNIRYERLQTQSQIESVASNQYQQRINEKICDVEMGQDRNLYELSKTIMAENALTRDLIQRVELDKIKDELNQLRTIAASGCIVDKIKEELRPTAKPAYPAYSPYQMVPLNAYQVSANNGFNGFNCGF